MKLVEHLEKLQYFYEVAKFGSIKKAADAIFMTQPSLSKSIKILEDVIGKQLFIRMPRGVAMTQEGELLFKFCHHFFASISDLEQKLTHPDDPLAGSLRVGTYDSIGIYFWPKFLKTFLPQYPKLSLKMETGRSRAMQEKLEVGELDLILIIDPQKRANIQVEILKRDTFKIYQSTRSRKVYQNIDHAPFIYMPDALAGTACLKDVMTRKNGDERQHYTTTSLESVKELTLNGIGLGLLPQMVAQEAQASGKLEEVKLKNIPSKGLGEHTIGIAYQKLGKNAALLDLLVRLLKKETW